MVVSPYRIECIQHSGFIWMKMQFSPEGMSADVSGHVLRTWACSPNVGMFSERGHVLRTWACSPNVALALKLKRWLPDFAAHRSEAKCRHIQNGVADI
jgi:hypothetical protein